MRTKPCVVIAGLGLLAALTAKPIVAHHAFNAEFDAKRPVKFKGTVTKMVLMRDFIGDVVVDHHPSVTSWSSRRRERRCRTIR